MDLDRDMACMEPLKIILLGASGVGKSQILNRLNGNEYSATLASTIGVEFLGKTFVVQEKKIKVQIWDTAGQERFASMMSTYYRRSHGVVLVHDVSQPSTFLAMEKWRLKLQDHVDSDDCKIIILANKIDLLDTDYDMQKTNKYAEEHGAIGTFATSAMTNCNIEVAFQNLVTAIAKKEKKKKTKESPTMDQERQLSDPSDPSDIQPRSGVVLTLINSKTYRSAKNRRSRGCC